MSSGLKPGAALTLLLCLALGLGACMGPSPVPAPENIAPPAAAVEPPKRVVALSSSLAQIWLLAGSELVGTSSDTMERGFDALSPDVAVVGTVKEPGIEAILDLTPDFVILSADIAGHAALKQTLSSAGIAHHYAHVETFSDYLETLELFCGITGKSEFFDLNGARVKKRVDSLLSEYEPNAGPVSYLLMRVHSSGGKVIANDHVAVDILSDLGAVNIAAVNKSLLSDLSLEAILQSDPDIIFVVTMGDEGAALKTLEQVFTLQPAWQSLSAVKAGRVHILQKDLFHYKPNARWGEAYETLIDLLNAG